MLFLRTMLCAVAVIVVATNFVTSAMAEEFRTWTDATGKFRTKAVFVELNGAQLKLKKEDGRVIEIPLEKLSESDQAYVRQHTDSVPSAAESETNPKAPASAAVEKYVAVVLEMSKRDDVDSRAQFSHLLNARIFGKPSALLTAFNAHKYSKGYSPVIVDGNLTPEYTRTNFLLQEYLKEIDIRSAALRDLVKTDAESDAQEVAILLDTDIVGDGLCLAEHKIGDIRWFMFLRPNRLSIGEIETRIGEPTARKTTERAEYLFYGRFLVFQPKTQDTPCVLRLHQNVD